MKEKLNQATQELYTMLQNNKGYRSDELYGSPRRPYKALDILEYEYEDLGNEDILNTMFELGYIDEPENDKAIEYIEQLEELAGESYLGLWLFAFKENIKDYFTDDEEFNQQLLDSVVEFELPPKALPISDLGSQGVLWIFPKSEFKRY